MTEHTIDETAVEERTMQAMTQHRYGSVEAIEPESIPIPVVDDDRVLIRVHAAGVNPLDWHYMRGRPRIMRLVSGLRRPKPATRGVDVAGTVVAAGKNVSRLHPGDEVFGMGTGTFAEYATGPESSLIRKPDQLTHEQAAAVPVAAVTALQGLRDLGRVRAGHEVLIIGASGGVGTFAVQIAKAFGANVTGVCSGRNVELVESLGADQVIDYTKNDAMAGAGEYDVVFQLAGTESPLRLRRMLNRNGTLVLSSGAGRLSGLDRVVKALLVTRFVSQRLVTWVADNKREDLLTLAEMMISGTVVPVIDRTYPLAETRAAITYVEAGHTQGKVVITI